MRGRDELQCCNLMTFRSNFKTSRRKQKENESVHVYEESGSSDPKREFIVIVILWFYYNPIS